MIKTNLSTIRAFAIKAHHDTNHLYNGSPYSVHLSMVAEFAIMYKDCAAHLDFDTILAACYLHDTIEDCRLTYNDIVKVAGNDVAAIVYALTNEKGRNRKERANDAYYEGIKKTVGAPFVKLCDRLANVSYSVDTHSSMVDAYKKEHEGFRARFNIVHYRDMITHLDNMLLYYAPKIDLA